MDAKGVDDVNDVLVGVKLAEFLALLGRYELLEYAAKDVVGYLPEIVIFEAGEEAGPPLAGGV